jgi:hypothetical protein
MGKRKSSSSSQLSKLAFDPRSVLSPMIHGSMKRHTLFESTCLAVFLSLTVPSSAAIFGFQRKAPDCPVASAVVLDFSVAPRVVESRVCPTRELQYSTKPVEAEKEIRGWGTGAQDVYYNPNVGRIAADLFAEAVRDCRLYNVYPRDDLKYYYADKKEVLQTELGLTTKQQEEAILSLNPVSIGRELGVDKVIVGQICDSELRHSRVGLGYFASVATLNVVIYDVATGRLEYQKQYYNRKGRSSQYTNYETIAQELADDLRGHHGGRVVPNWSLRNR